MTTIRSAQKIIRQPRAHGAVTLSVKAGERGTTLDGLRQSGSLKALFPRIAGPDIQSVMINTAGGITGGDTFNLKAHAKAETRLTLTTQTAERAYRAQPGETGLLKNQLVIDSGARVHWLPQETILYQGSALSRSLHVEIGHGASFLMVEPLVFGRTAMGETLTDASFTDRIEIHREGRLQYLDAVKLTGNITAQLARAHTADGAGAMASLVYSSADAEVWLAPIRAKLGNSGGVSLISDQLLVLRLLAPDSYLLRQTLIPILNLITNDNLPRCWMT